MQSLGYVINTNITDLDIQYLQFDDDFDHLSGFQMSTSSSLLQHPCHHLTHFHWHPPHHGSVSWRREAQGSMWCAAQSKILSFFAIFQEKDSPRKRKGIFFWNNLLPAWWGPPAALRATAWCRRASQDCPLLQTSYCCPSWIHCPCWIHFNPSLLQASWCRRPRWIHLEVLPYQLDNLELELEASGHIFDWQMSSTGLLGFQACHQRFQINPTSEFTLSTFLHLRLSTMLSYKKYERKDINCFWFTIFVLNLERM